MSDFFVVVYDMSMGYVI